MERYTIYCTEEQTRKALELGAPINLYRYKIGPCFTEVYDDEYAPPITAEQMIGWLEEQKNIILYIKPSYRKDGFIMGYEYVISANDIPLISNKTFYDDARQEATLAAIDAALEYLMNNK